MKNILHALAFALGLLPLAAMAQSAPANLPAMSVYGRLGFPGTVGPGQAVPFATLTRQFFSAATFQVGNPGHAALYSQIATPAAGAGTFNAMQIGIGTALTPADMPSPTGRMSQAIVGTSVIDAADTIMSGYGVVGFGVSNSTSLANSIGVGGWGFCNGAAGASSCWGMGSVVHNKVLSATVGLDANSMIGQETDIAIWKKAGGVEPTISHLQGYLVTGGGDSTANQGNAVEVDRLNVETGAKWANAFASDPGAALVAFLAGPTAKTGNTLASQPILLNSVNGTGTTLTQSIQGDAAGDLILQSSINAATGLGDVNGNYVVASAAVGGAKVKFPALAVAGFIANDAAGVLSTSPFGTGVKTALGVNVGSAGAPVLLNGAGGTPSAITLTNGSGLPTSGLTGTLQAAQEPAHTGDCTNTAGSLALTCLKTNGSSFGTAATQNTGTSGATVPLLNGGNTYSGSSTYSGQIITTFGTPTIASGACGTGTNGTISGTNQAGTVTIGAVATTTCTVSFSATITAPNACVITPGNATAAAQGTTLAWVGAPSTTQWVITGAALASTVYRYHCI